jgi:hypothetical protein
MIFEVVVGGPVMKIAVIISRTWRLRQAAVLSEAATIRL